jgi:L-lactate dehydrogenase (cytochrome)
MNTRPDSISTSPSDATEGGAKSSALAVEPALRKVLCLDDFEAAARCYLPRPMFEYVVGGAETNISRLRNREVFGEFEFVPRVLVDVSGRSTATTLFGHRFAAPVGIAPMGLSALLAYRGDLVMAAASMKANVPMVVSGTSLIRMEDVIAINPDAWFQAYLPGAMHAIEALVERAATAGYGTLVLTVDTSVPANRENNVRAGFSTPLRPSLRLLMDGITHPRWTIGTLLRTIALHGMPHFENSYAHRGAPILSRTVERDFAFRDHLNWSHLAHIRRMWKGRLVVKGVLNPTDARQAVDLGADGIIVSNHGGRQLDGSISPMRALPKVVEACPSIPIMLDSGVRRGSDVLKALALGAKFVFVGRPFTFAAAVAGEAGVRHAIGLLASEIDRNMGLLGINGVGDVRLGEHVVPHIRAIHT